MKVRFVIPLILFLIIIVLLWRGLFLHPTEIPSPLINKPVPIFALSTLSDATHIMTQKNFLGHITVFNVWASWCEACAAEQAFLLTLSQKADFILAGLNYKDENLAAKKWLLQYGNPYAWVLVDKTGAVAIDWGVYGTPETFVIDKKGMIRYKHIGPLTPEAWEKNIKPLIIQLQAAP